MQIRQKLTCEIESTTALGDTHLILQDFCDADGSVVAEEGSPDLMHQAEALPGDQNSQAPVCVAWNHALHVSLNYSLLQVPSITRMSEKRIYDKLDISLLEERLNSADAGRRLEGYLALVVRQLQRHLASN